MANSLEGKIALVTGGTKGIGKAIADKLSSLGAKVIITARTKPNEEIAHYFIAGDLINPNTAQVIGEELLEKFGKVDIVVNNAGANTSPGGGYSSLTDEDWNNEIQLNLMSAVRVNKALIPAMVAQREGVIINISTGAALQPLWKMTMSYSASKAALNAYTKALASELGPQGIRVNAVSPGLVKTPLMEAFIEDIAKKSNVTFDEAFGSIKAEIGDLPLGRMAEPEEVAELVSFLVSPEAKYITGSNYRIDGGAIPTV
ncbi:3-oxoacyl-[acyl-carrier-protein] reductase FabG [compost metagenome]|uniref:SDR family oxidoreductase n=1 Tax=Sphingobacterium detergens TaxID=1145106 RepID=UPI000FA04703